MGLIALTHGILALLEWYILGKSVADVLGKFPFAVCSSESLRGVE